MLPAEGPWLIPHKRIGEPEEVGWLATFLASDYADYITGSSLFIDGGMMLMSATGSSSKFTKYRQVPGQHGNSERSGISCCEWEDANHHTLDKGEDICHSPQKGTLMPLARIDLPAGKPSEYGRAVADAVYDAMIATLNVPRDDRFQVISEHTARARWP
jgi:hypothetical protein